MKATVEISARHIHLTAEDYLTLFGKAEMTKRNNLSQKGEFASTDTVEIVGPKNRLMDVRVLGPFRDDSQFELSKTDCFYLGIEAPYLESGTGKGATVKIVGPKSEILSNIAIVAMRHLHLSPLNASKLGLRDGEFVSIKTDGPRSTTLYKIVIRVADNFINHIHLDTDDANASGITSGDQAEIIIS